MYSSPSSVRMSGKDGPTYLRLPSDESNSCSLQRADGEVNPFVELARKMKKFGDELYMKYLIAKLLFHFKDPRNISLGVRGNGK